MTKTLTGAALMALMTLLATTAVQAQTSSDTTVPTVASDGTPTNPADESTVTTTIPTVDDPGTPPAEGPKLTLEGRIGPGDECPVIHTKEGKVYALEGNIDATDDGAYVRLTGTIDPSANFCLESKEVILVETLEHIKK
ncbi:hypothetical protein DLJ53_02530 [Acuticoccus sediminis]|uniref:Uncharacterized protein n=1 Tax=Acuticoccus sediminis TaxID=2184697 RepID=A0A8B2NT78_9HYPH|nr:DUF5818 domain-containing protein [Acuticoccus sediminis]RAI03408.1 hypothetical protein DLJ53_02530 [Acuticoccus sediminis]